MFILKFLNVLIDSRVNLSGKLSVRCSDITLLVWLQWSLMEIEKIAINLYQWRKNSNIMYKSRVCA